ncbi:MAG: acetylglutamate kinase [Bacteroidales bacterium]|jgi:acetylglutamate kinase|nr:acetylglutamate kinase [Bacteroidales bacterium]
MDKRTITIVKIGGNVIDNPDSLDKFLKDFGNLRGFKILVHGGGKIVSELLKELGIEVKMYRGRRITGPETIRIATMVYAGLINKTIVATLQKNGCNALGLSGADGNCIRANKRPPLIVGDDPEAELLCGKDNRGKTVIDWGYVGDPDSSGINSKLLGGLLENGYSPVLSAITHDGSGSLLNTNADTIAANIAAALSSEYDVKLVYCFEKAGILRDPDNDDSVIPVITRDLYKKLLDGKIITGGMIPKTGNAFDALEKGVREIYIKKAEDLLNDKGTVIK